MTHELDVMARTVFGEARGEPKEGKIAVAWVIKNRADNPKWWGKSIVSVCQAPWQFSCWNKNDPNRAKLLAVLDSDPVFQECLEVCLGVIDGTYPDPTDGANHYHTKAVRPHWAMNEEPTVTIGNHLFYRL
jgi:spore germination cell wall hydrolase CwlJ-like protein